MIQRCYYNGLTPSSFILGIIYLHTDIINPTGNFWGKCWPTWLKLLHFVHFFLAIPATGWISDRGIQPLCVSFTISGNPGSDNKQGINSMWGWQRICSSGKSSPSSSENNNLICLLVLIEAWRRIWCISDYFPWPAISHLISSSHVSCLTSCDQLHQNNDFLPQIEKFQETGITITIYSWHPDETQVCIHPNVLWWSINWNYQKANRTGIHLVKHLNKIILKYTFEASLVPFHVPGFNYFSSNSIIQNNREI